MSQSPPQSPAPDNERLKIAVDAWKYIVSVQMHFNDMEMKIRNLYFTILAAAIGAIGVVQGKQIQIPYLDLEISLGMLVMISVIPISMLFYFIDRHWYHRLLQGAVEQATEIEKKYEAELPEIQLGRKVSKASPLEFPRRWRWIFFFVKEKKFWENSRIHSDAKIEILYKSVVVGISAIALVDALVKGIQFQHNPLLYWIVLGAKACANFLWTLLSCRHA